jgi:DNA-binding CsgD family transcriptional regulator
LGRAIIELIEPRLAHEYLFIAFLPIKFELPSITSKAKYKAIADGYVRQVRHANKYDPWMRRSPIGATVTVVRHSDYTPLSLLKRTVFYRDILQPTNSAYGASIVAWHGTTWLATLTVLRNEKQGDFSDADMAQLLNWQRHFEVAVRRLALKKEAQLDDNSLSTFIWDLPTSALLLDWDLVPRHFNAAAMELCAVWRRGVSAYSKKTKNQKITVPDQILALIPRLKPRIESAKLARPGPLRPVEFETLRHPTIPGLFAKIYFIPSKSLTVSRGRFLIQLYHDRGSHTQSSAATYSKLSRLSRYEREVALHAAKGLSNIEIGKVLKKSPGTVKIQLSQVYRKLHLKSRSQLANALASSFHDKRPPAAAAGSATIKILP